MKRLAAFCLVIASSPCFAAFSSQVLIANDYIWRGRSLTAHVVGEGAQQTGVPAIQGTIQYDDESGFGASLFASNIFLGYEFIPEVFYNYKLSDFTFQVEAQEYFFPTFTKGNTIEVGVSVAWKGATALAQWNPEYLGSETNSMYYNLGYIHALTTQLNGLAAVGWSKFGDEKKSLSSNYSDYKVGIQYHKEDYITEIAFVTSNRETLDGTTFKRSHPFEDKYLVSFAKNF